MSPDPAMFSCTADGVPRPDITWLRVSNGTEMEVLEDSSTQITTTTLSDRFIMSVLTFSETQPFGSGVYVCLVTNLLGSARKMAWLTVNGNLKSITNCMQVTAYYCTADMPQFITPIKAYTVNETNPVMFECSASGIPAPTISWFRINQTVSTPLVLTNGTRSLISPPQVDNTYELPGGRGTASLVTSTLTIPATQDEDSGQYACQALNDFGNETRELELIVRGNLKTNFNSNLSCMSLFIETVR